MSEHPSLQILRTRVGALPEVVSQAVHAALPGTKAQRDRFLGMRRFVVTGGGLSEGPARVMVALLRRLGRDARFEPQSAFSSTRAPEPESALVLFSQGLAPNARLPLPSMTAAYGASLLVTSVVPGSSGMGALVQQLLDRDALVWTLPPASEDKLLLRVLGPAVALVAAVRIAELFGAEPSALQLLPEVVARRIREPAVDLFAGQRRPIALVAEPRLLDLAMPLRWKLLEGLRVPDPPVWDVLQVAHGPLQSFYDHPMTLVALRTLGTTDQDDLFVRLRSVLQSHHHVVELRAVVPGPAALLELDAALDAALVSTLAVHPLALDTWPSQGKDGPLYDVTVAEGLG